MLLRHQSYQQPREVQANKGCQRGDAEIRVGREKANLEAKVENINHKGKKVQRTITNKDLRKRNLQAGPQASATGKLSK